MSGKTLSEGPSGLPLALGEEGLASVSFRKIKIVTRESGDTAESTDAKSE